MNIVVRKVGAADWTRARLVFWRWCKATGRSRDDVDAWQDFLSLLVLRSIGDLENMQFAEAPRGAGRFG